MIFLFSLSAHAGTSVSFAEILCSVVEVTRPKSTDSKIARALIYLKDNNVEEDILINFQEEYSLWRALTRHKKEYSAPMQKLIEKMELDYRKRLHKLIKSLEELKNRKDLATTERARKIAASLENMFAVTPRLTKDPSIEHSASLVWNRFVNHVYKKPHEMGMQDLNDQVDTFNKLQKHYREAIDRMYRSQDLNAHQAYFADGTAHSTAARYSALKMSEKFSEDAGDLFGESEFSKFFDEVLRYDIKGVERKNVQLLGERVELPNRKYKFSFDTNLELPNGAKVDFYELKRNMIFKDSKGEYWYVHQLDTNGPVVVKVERNVKTSLFKNGEINSANAQLIKLNHVRRDSIARTIRISTSSGFHELQVIFPKFVENHMGGKLDEVQDLLARIPDEHISSIEKIDFYTTEKTLSANADKGIGSGYEQTKINGTALGTKNGTTRISFFPRKYDLEKIFFHEFGHALARKVYGTTMPDARWFKAIADDGTSVSKYGSLIESEDFAETVRLYFTSNGGLDHPAYRRDFANRFKILDEFFNENKSLKELATVEAKRNMQAKHATTVMGGLGGLIFYVNGTLYMPNN